MSTDKKANFIRVAESRTNKIINSIESLGNLSNQYYYEYSQDQIDDIFDAIQTELDTQKKKLKNAKTNKKFTL